MEENEIVENVCGLIDRSYLVIKPYLLNFIKSKNRTLLDEDANRIIKRIVTDQIIDEYLALGKSGKPYPFYVKVNGKKEFNQIIAPIMLALTNKELTIVEACRVTGYSSIVSRALLTHLLLLGQVDYSGDMEFPVFFVPWR